MNVRIDKVMDISAYACYISFLYFRDANIYLKNVFIFILAKLIFVSNLYDLMNRNVSVLKVQ